MNLKSIFNQKNLDKTLKSFDKIMADFNSGLKDLGDSMGKVDQDFKDDIEKSDNNAKSRAVKDRENMDKLIGKKKNIWSDKK